MYGISATYTPRRHPRARITPWRNWRRRWVWRWRRSTICYGCVPAISVIGSTHGRDSHTTPLDLLQSRTFPSTEDTYAQASMYREVQSSWSSSNRVKPRFCVHGMAVKTSPRVWRRSAESLGYPVSGYVSSRHGRVAGSTPSPRRRPWSTISTSLVPGCVPPHSRVNSKELVQLIGEVLCWIG